MFLPPLTPPQGYTTGGRLLQATCKVFSAYCFRRGLTVHMQRCFRMSYRTDIPRMVRLCPCLELLVLFTVIWLC